MRVIEVDRCKDCPFISKTSPKTGRCKERPNWPQVRLATVDRYCRLKVTASTRKRRAVHKTDVVGANQERFISDGVPTKQGAYLKQLILAVKHGLRPSDYLLRQADKSVQRLFVWANEHGPWHKGREAVRLEVGRKPDPWTPEEVTTNKTVSAKDKRYGAKPV